MGTEVLRPQDLLAERFRDSPASFHHRRKYSPATGNKHFNYNINNTNNHGYRNQAVVRPVQKKKSPEQQPSFDDFKVVSKHAKNNIIQNNEFSMKKVTILRRGASLDSLNEKIKKTTGASAGDLFPDTMYAGSAFSVSPSPCDLPLPTFFKKHQSFDDSASRNLRRLLRLE